MGSGFRERSCAEKISVRITHTRPGEGLLAGLVYDLPPDKARWVVKRGIGQACDMDQLHAYVLLLHAKAERDALKARIAALERDRSMTTRLRGIGEAMRKLRHALDAQADTIAAQITTVETGASQAGDKIRAELAQHQATVDELNAVSQELAGSNLPPND